MSFHGPPRQCHLCQEFFGPDAVVFRTVGGSFPEGDPCHGFYYVDLHWDCYARWPHQERFAAVLFAGACQRAEMTPHWGISVRTEQVLITINPHQYAERIDVDVARTGASYVLRPPAWSSWLAAPPATHPFEREALEEALAPHRSTLTSPGALLACASWPGRDRALERQRQEAARRRLQRQAYRLARQRATRVAQEGMACPRCGAFRRDHTFHDGASRRVPSFFVCAACAQSFSAA